MNSGSVINTFKIGNYEIKLNKPIYFTDEEIKEFEHLSKQDYGKVALFLTIKLWNELNEYSSEL